MLSSHFIVSSSRSVRPCSLRVGRWIGHRRTTWSMVCCSESAQHSQVAKEAIPHLWMQEWKGPTSVRRQLSQTHALLGRVIPGRWVPVSGMKVQSLEGLYLSNHSTFHQWCGQCTALLLLSSDELICCCAARTNGFLNLKRCAFALGEHERWVEQVSYSMTQRARDSVTPLQRSSTGWMPVRM